MNTITNIRRKSKSGLEHQYAWALRNYARRGGEALLGKAYELGRRATNDGKSLIEMASLHHQCLFALCREAKGDAQRAAFLKAAADFLTESLSPYEMAHRGFQDAVKALKQLNETLEEEIKRIASSVHDEAGQLLVAVHLALAEVSGQLPDIHRQQLATIEPLLDQVENQLRRYSHELRPTILDDLGWIPAIRFLAEGVSKRANLPIQIRTKVGGRLPAPVEIALYRVVQEALTNITKHARARCVAIQVSRNGRMLCCSIADDGAGFDSRSLQSDRARKGLGLIGMHERVNSLGGTLSIDSAPGRGTKLMIHVPLTKDSSHARSRRPR
jgi:signal transduction histidine kinase